MSDPSSAGELEQFHEAVKQGQLDTVRERVLAAPHLIMRSNSAGQNAVLLAQYYRQPAVAEFLLAQKPSLDAFTAAAIGQTSAVLDQLRRDSALLSKRNSDGWTLLHLAAFFGHPDLVRTLLDEDADVDARSTNAMENTPLHAGIAGGNLDAVRTLLEHGAAPNAQQNGGWTALHGAAQNGNRALVELLLAHHADVNARAANNQSALDMALLRGHAGLAAFLEERGATSR